MKKVLITATVQSHVAQFHKPLIKLLKSKGYEVHVAARNNLSEKNGLKLEDVDKIFDVPFSRSPFNKKNLVAYKKINDILRDDNYCIVHCNTPMGGVVTRLAAHKYRKKGLKIFYTAHGFHFYKGAPIKNWLIYYPIEKYLANYTDTLITITREDYQLATKKFNTKVSHVYGVGVDTKKNFKCPDVEMLKNSKGYLKEEFILICIGELNKNKNQKTIIKALPEMLKKNPNVRLLLAGNGPLEHELKKLVESLNISEKVDFLGYVTNLNEYINISNVVVSASYREGLPLNIMEAMATEKAVVVSNNRGHRELVQDGETGFIVSPDSSNEYTEAINRLYNDESLRIRMGKKGYEKLQPYMSESVVSNLEREYFSNE